MALSTKVNWLAAGIALLVAVGLTLLMLSRDYQTALDTQSTRFMTAVLQAPELPSDIQRVTERQLDALIEELLSVAGAAHATVRDSSGETIRRSNAAVVVAGQEPSIGALRKGAPPASLARVSLDTHEGRVRGGLLSAMVREGTFVHLTLPVFSAVDSSRDDLQSEEVGRATIQPGSIRPVEIVGYAHLAVSPRDLMATMKPRVLAAAAGGLLFFVVCVALTLLATRRLLTPLSDMAGRADEIAANWLEKPVDFNKVGLVEGVGTVMEEVVEGLEQYKACVDQIGAKLGISTDIGKIDSSSRDAVLADAARGVAESQARLVRMAYYDSLTALPNRHLFGEQLDQLLRMAERNGQQLALLFVDLDNFKQINDSLGHVTGDLFLKEIADRLRHCVRESDLVAHNVDNGPSIDISRLGGDEFTIILNQVEFAETASHVAERVIGALQEPLHVDGHDVHVSCSIGIALAPGDASTSKDLLKAADTAMYHAKGNGKNKFAYYQEQMDAPAIDQFRLERDLRNAIQKKELTLHYQPQIDTRDGTVLGAEALLRWNHPKQGLVPPMKFIPLAEEIDYIGELGKWALQEACRQLKVFAARNIALPKITANISALQFDSQFIDTVREVLDESGVDPGQLQLELTESVVVKDIGASVRVLKELKALGVGLSIDNFGTGYSPLRYLSSFPLDELKIDRSFVMSSQASHVDSNLVIAMIGLARNMRLEIVAEGVETAEQYQFLKQNGAHVMQGYLFSPPVNAEEFELLLTPRHFKRRLKDIDQKAGGPHSTGADRGWSRDVEISQN